MHKMSDTVQDSGLNLTPENEICLTTLLCNQLSNTSRFCSRLKAQWFNVTQVEAHRSK